MNFAQNGLKQSVFALKTCKKPEYEISVTEHKLLNDTFRFPGVLKWKPIDVTMVSVRGDSEVLDVSNILHNYVISVSGYQVYGRPDANVTDNSNNIIKATGIAKDNFRSTLGNSLELIQLDSDSNEIEKWTIYHPFISNINYGTLTYENDGFVEISFTLQYDYAKLQTFAAPPPPPPKEENKDKKNETSKK